MNYTPNKLKGGVAPINQRFNLIQTISANSSKKISKDERKIVHSQSVENRLKGGKQKKQSLQHQQPSQSHTLNSLLKDRIKRTGSLEKDFNISQRFKYNNNINKSLKNPYALKKSQSSKPKQTLQYTNKTYLNKPKSKESTLYKNSNTQSKKNSQNSFRLKLYYPTMNQKRSEPKILQTNKSKTIQNNSGQLSEKVFHRKFMNSKLINKIEEQDEISKRYIQNQIMQFQNDSLIFGYESQEPEQKKVNGKNMQAQQLMKKEKVTKNFNFRKNKFMKNEEIMNLETIEYGEKGQIAEKIDKNNFEESFLLDGTNQLELSVIGQDPNKYTIQSQIE